jgi:hypothetical protein
MNAMIRESCARTFPLSPSLRSRVIAPPPNVPFQQALSQLLFIRYKPKMVLPEALAWLFPSHLAMLAWQMLKGMLVLSACKMMIFKFCPSQQECLGGAFTRCQHRSLARTTHNRAILDQAHHILRR